MGVWEGGSGSHVLSRPDDLILENRRSLPFIWMWKDLSLQTFACSSVLFRKIKYEGFQRSEYGIINQQPCKKTLRDPILWGDCCQWAVL
ncbi:unnamed protein product [Calypogeia fissa]